MSTDKEGHCRHCIDACKRVSSGELTPVHFNARAVRWVYPGCPACAEAERITAWLLAEAERLGESDSHDSRVASAAHAHAAVKILKGEI